MMVQNLQETISRHLLSELELEFDLAIQKGDFEYATVLQALIAHIENQAFVEGGYDAESVKELTDLVNAIVIFRGEFGFDLESGRSDDRLILEILNDAKRVSGASLGSGRRH